MIERDIVAQKIKEFQIAEHVKGSLTRSGYSKTKLQRTPLGEKIIVYVSRPGLVVGRQGTNIRKLTQDLKEKFNLENPQVEVNEVKDIYLDASIVAEMIALSLERFGTQRFKGVMHKTLENVLNAGALGVEIILSGKLPSARARSWRVYGGYLKKCGDVAVHGVRSTVAIAQLKSGIIGIKVKIMPPDLRLPDNIIILDEKEVVFEEVAGEESAEAVDEKEASKKEEPKEKKPRKKVDKAEKEAEEPEKIVDKPKAKAEKKVDKPKEPEDKEPEKDKPEKAPEEVKQEIVKPEEKNE